MPERVTLLTSWPVRSVPTSVGFKGALAMSSAIVISGARAHSSGSWLGASDALLELVPDEDRRRVHDEHDREQQHDRRPGQLVELRLRLLDQVEDLDRQRGVAAVQTIGVEQDRG